MIRITATYVLGGETELEIEGMHMAAGAIADFLAQDRGHTQLLYIVIDPRAKPREEQETACCT